LDNIINNTKSDEIRSYIQKLISETTSLREALPSSKTGEALVTIAEKTEIEKFTVSANMSNITIGNSIIRELEVLDPSLILEQQAHARMVELESSLPENASLQPGNTAVYTILLNTKKPFLFRPSRYRLQFNISYGFSPKSSKTTNQPLSVSEQIFINTISHELSIRASIFSVIAGSAIGGFIGGLARFLQVTPITRWQQEILTNIVTIIVAILLSIISIIFVARKSETQSFVSVEDFWGGILIGFLVGYSGTTFFESLTGIKPTP
jgi:hypothetical protein